MRACWTGQHRHKFPHGANASSHTYRLGRSRFPPCAQVFSCGSCKREITRDPLRYDLFDGHRPDESGDGWEYTSIGLGDAMPTALSALTSDEENARTAPLHTDADN